MFTTMQQPYLLIGLANNKHISRNEGMELQMRGLVRWDLELCAWVLINASDEARAAVEQVLNLTAK